MDDRMLSFESAPSCCTEFREQFRLKKFLFRLDNPNVFRSSAWIPQRLRFSMAAFMGYRVTMAAVWVSWLLYMTAGRNSSAKFLIFLTDWSFVLCVLNQVVLAGFCAFYLRRRQLIETYSYFYKVCFFINSVATNAICSTSLLFFIILYPFMNGELSVAEGPLLHGLNMAVVLLDLWLSSAPIRILHAAYMMAIGVVYILFSVVYAFSGGKGIRDAPYIYPVLDWLNKPGLAVATLFGSLVFCFVVQILLFFCTAIARDRCQYLACSSRNQLENSDDVADLSYRRWRREYGSTVDSIDRQTGPDSI